MKRRNGKRNWAEQVPWIRSQGPYRDYGWERHQSALPEFRDPTIHFMPYERERLEPWQRSRERKIFDWRDFSGREDWSRPGPHTGKGPRDYTRSDERLFEEVCDRMAQDGQLDASDIDVEVANGEVTLMGSVANRQAKRRAEDIADAVHGVRDVHNLLHLQQGSPLHWIDEAGGSGVYPASEAGKAPDDSEAHGMASWGQGERGAAGYDDHGGSELHLGRTDDEES